MPTPTPSDDVLRSVLGAIDCGVVVHDADGSIVASNEKALNLLGLTAAQLHGRDSFDPRWSTVTESGEPFLPEHHPAQVALATGQRVSGVVMGVDRPIQDPNGGARVWILITATPLHDASGATERVVVTFADITHQREAERALREEHTFHKEMMGTVLAGITVLSPSGRITYANRRAQELLGLERSELEGMQWNAPRFRISDLEGRAIPEEELPFARLRRTLAPVWDMRHAIETPDGERRLLSINGAPLFREPDETGDGPVLRGAVFALHDITATASARRELRLSEQRLRMAAWAANLALVEWEVGGALRIDEGWLRSRGWGDQPIPSTVKGWRRILGAADLARLDAARDQHFAGQTKNIDVELELPTSRPTTARLVARAVGWNRKGRPERVAGMLADVTAERQAREQRRSLHHQMLETAAFEATARVTGGMANDFNNLLVGILGATDRARQLLQGGNPRAQEQLTLVESTAQRAADLSRELLAMSGHGRFRLGPLALGPLVRETRGALVSARQRASRMRLKIAPGLPLVEGDPGQLRRMLYHLVSNAVDALGGDAGAVTVAVDTRTLGPTDRPWIGPAPAAPSPWVCLQVQDDGEGMDPAQLPDLLRPFTSSREGRRGLGLAAVQGIVRGHGGMLAIETQPGRGTSVTVALPMVSSPTPAPMSSEQHETTFEPRPARVLLVDDEPVVLQVSARILRKAGYTVTTAIHGGEGLERWREEGPFDAVVSDLSMPVMDGEALVRALRSDQPELPILVMSGYSRSDVVGRMVGAGSVEFLPKPFRPRHLVQILARLLAQKPDPGSH